MPFYSAPFTFDFSTELIYIDNGITDVDCADLYDAIKLAQTSTEGVVFARIAAGSGLIDLGPGVAVGLTIELLGNWQLQFAAGNYSARIAGGNLVGGPGGDPIAYTPGVQAVLIQSAASTVVTEGGSVPTPGDNAAAVWGQLIENSNLTAGAIQEILLAVAKGQATLPQGDGAYVFRDEQGAALVSGTISGTTRTPD